MGEFEFACTECPEGGSGRSSELSRIRIDIPAELISVGYTLLVIPPDNIDYCVIGPIRRNYPYLYYCLDRKGLIKGIQAGVI